MYYVLTFVHLLEINTALGALSQHTRTLHADGLYEGLVLRGGVLAIGLAEDAGHLLGLGGSVHEDCRSNCSQGRAPD